MSGFFQPVGESAFCLGLVKERVTALLSEHLEVPDRTRVRADDFEHSAGVQPVEGLLGLEQRQRTGESRGIEDLGDGFINRWHVI